ncbi:hypothetical protein B0J12DRAFT_121596 [Macrophomina phaseolina]|uniref:Uncharacterized protein n=1 Tax=Macrophomina phaseolina TaxID=35725 RepID=A0ABQ8G7Q6_9PEZI|nr:hypothetical protein B0J12DRAFT_121596 [Macrophomina phaseolina]
MREISTEDAGRNPMPRLSKSASHTSSRPKPDKGLSQSAQPANQARNTSNHSRHPKPDTKSQPASQPHEPSTFIQPPIDQLNHQINPITKPASTTRPCPAQHQQQQRTPQAGASSPTCCSTKPTSAPAPPTPAPRRCPPPNRPKATARYATPDYCGPSAEPALPLAGRRPAQPRPRAAAATKTTKEEEEEEEVNHRLCRPPRPALLPHPSPGRVQDAAAHPAAGAHAQLLAASAAVLLHADGIVPRSRRAEVRDALPVLQVEAGVCRSRRSCSSDREAKERTGRTRRTRKRCNHSRTRGRRSKPGEAMRCASSTRWDPPGRRRRLRTCTRCLWG